MTALIDPHTEIPYNCSKESFALALFSETEGMSIQKDLATVGKHKSISGIYLILNTISGKGYIGQAQDIQRRCLQHLKALRKGTHYNPHLQRAWNQDGEGVFEFRQMESCPVDRLDEREQFHIDRFISKDLLYNIARDAESPMRDRMMSAETRRKKSKAAREAFKNMTPDNQAKVRRVLKGRALNAKRKREREKYE